MDTCYFSHSSSIVLISTLLLLLCFNRCCCMPNSIRNYYYHYPHFNKPYYEYYTAPAASEYDDSGETETSYFHDDYGYDDESYYDNNNDQYQYEDDYYYYNNNNGGRDYYLKKHELYSLRNDNENPMMPDRFGYPIPADGYYEGYYDNHYYANAESYGDEYDSESNPYNFDEDDFLHDAELQQQYPTFSPPPPYPPQPFGSPDPGIKTQTGFEGYLVPNSGYGLLPWGIEGVVIVIAAIIIFVIILIAIICLIAWFTGIRKVLPSFFISSRSSLYDNEPETSRTIMHPWNSSHVTNLTIQVFNALEKYNNL